MGRKGAVLVLIPARGGSKGVPRKNLRTVSGVSLVGRTVIRARSFVTTAGLGDRARILVDTDDSEIAAEAARWGAPVPFLRPDRLARDETSTLDTVLHALERLDDLVETVVLLQPTSPLWRVSDLFRCWQVFDADQRPSVVSMVDLGHSVDLTVHLDGKQRVRWAMGRAPGSSRRQDHAQPFRPNGAVYINAATVLTDRRAFVVEGLTQGVPMAWHRSVDIDGEEDLRIAGAVAAGEAPPAWRSDSDSGDGEVVVLTQVPSQAPSGDLHVVVARPRLQDTMEEVLTAAADGSSRIGVEFDGGFDDTEGSLAQIEPLRSILGVPSCWVVGSGRVEDAARAVARGAAALVGDVPRGLLQPVTELRRSVNFA